MVTITKSYTVEEGDVKIQSYDMNGFEITVYDRVLYLEKDNLAVLCAILDEVKKELGWDAKGVA